MGSWVRELCVPEEWRAWLLAWHVSAGWCLLQAVRTLVRPRGGAGWCVAQGRLLTVGSGTLILRISPVSTSWPRVTAVLTPLLHGDTLWSSWPGLSCCHVPWRTATGQRALGGSLEGAGFPERPHWRWWV